MSGNQSKVDDKLRRLVREEVEAAIRPLRKQIAELKKELAGPEAGEPEKQGKAVSGQKSTAGFEAEDIARLRKKWKLKRDVFGEFFGVSGEEIRNWERGRNKPAPRHLELLAHIRGMSRKERVALLESIAAEKPAENL